MRLSSGSHDFLSPALPNLRYSEILFSGEPIVELVPVVDRRIDIVRHIAVRGSEVATVVGQHPQYDTLILAVNGAGRCRGRIGDALIDCTIGKGSIGFSPAGWEAELEFPSHQASYNIGIEKGRLAALLEGGSLGLEAPLVGHRNDRLTNLVSMLIGEASRPSFASDILVDGLLRAIAGTIARLDGVTTEPTRIRLTGQRLAMVTEFVEANLDRPLGLHDMAAAGGLSPFHFSRVFKHATGRTPYQYLMSRRLQRACRLLIENELPLAELALACGFANQSHFTAAFSRDTGLSPGRYRKQSQI